MSEVQTSPEFLFQTQRMNEKNHASFIFTTLLCFSWLSMKFGCLSAEIFLTKCVCMCVYCVYGVFVCFEEPNYKNWLFQREISFFQSLVSSLSTLTTYLCCTLLLSHVRLFVTLLTVPPRLLCLWGFSRQQKLEWVAMPSSRGSLQPRDQTHISYVSCIGRRVLSH